MMPLECKNHALRAAALLRLKFRRAVRDAVAAMQKDVKDEGQDVEEQNGHTPGRCSCPQR
jgi:hypothetical protein